MTEKTIFGVHVHVSPGSPETLVRRGGIANHHFDSILSRAHIYVCQKFPKSVDVH